VAAAAAALVVLVVLAVDLVTAAAAVALVATAFAAVGCFVSASSLLSCKNVLFFCFFKRVACYYLGLGVEMPTKLMFKKWKR